jgi:hypothetical protein
MSGTMRARLAKFGDVLFLDDTRSGVTSSGFSFWNVMVVNSEGKILYGMGAMTMTHGDDTVAWVLKSLVSMCTRIQMIAKTTLSDLGEYPNTVKVSFDTPSVMKWLPQVTFCGACTWHIMAIDFPKNLKSIKDYEGCKRFVKSNLVENTVDKSAWESLLAEVAVNGLTLLSIFSPWLNTSRGGDILGGWKT